MLKAFIEDRIIGAKNHPVATIVKLVAIAGIIASKRISPFICTGVLLSVLSLGIIDSEASYLIPQSDVERKRNTLLVSIIYSFIYALILAGHNVLYINILKDKFYIDNIVLAYMSVAYIFVGGISVGFDMEMGKMRKKKKNVATSILHCLEDVFCGMFLLQLFNTYCFSSFFDLGITDKQFYLVPAIGLVILLIEVCMVYKSIGVYDYCEWTKSEV